VIGHVALSSVFFGRPKGVPMTEHPRLPSDPRIVERAVVLQLLRDDHAELWSSAELETEFDDVAPEALSGAIEHLERQGVLLMRDGHVVASPSVRRVDELGLVGV
jgi:hypothetical protein